MLKPIFSVYDSAAKTYCVPFFSDNVATAVRAFAHAANDPSSEISRFPSDFILFHFGNFDTSTCEMITTTPVKLAVAITLVNNEGSDNGL